MAKVVADERAFLQKRRELAMRIFRDTENYTYAMAFVGLMIVVLAGTAVAVSVRGVWSDRMREMELALAAQRAEQAELMRVTHAATGAGTWSHDPQTGITEWSPEMLRLYGCEAAGGMPHGAALTALVHPEDCDKAPWCRGGGVGSSSFEANFRIAGCDGRWRWVASRGHADGVRVIGMDVDVTEQVEARDALAAVLAERAAEARVMEAQDAVRQMQKIETVGQMTGGVAHDLNNMLTPIVGYLDMLQRRHADDPRSARMVNMAMQSADRAKALVSKLLSFARRQQLEARVIDAASLVAGMREFVTKAIAGSGVEAAVESSDGPLCVRVDPNQLENVILNLAVNARDAMPDGGIVTLSVRRVDPDAADRPVGLAEGSYVVIGVEDHGLGMNEETLRRAVEPFYTTKGMGKGTGLGLSMAHGMAAQSGGALDLRSVPGRGTIASVWLPEADVSGLEAEEETGPETIVHLEPRRILLVDDDENVRRSIAQMLDDLGHRVVETASGAEALGVLAADRAFDMLVTDYLMPSMTGVELLKRVREAVPAMPTLLVSGYTSMRDHDPIAGVVRLAKPFTAARLSEAMGRVASVVADGEVARPHD